jgi:hypothetical protein
MRNGKRKNTRPLRCYCCDATGDKLTMDGAGNTRRVRGQTRRVQHVRCDRARGGCGREWWSMHPEALERGRLADRAAGS